MGPTTDYWQVGLGDQLQDTTVQHIASQGFSGWLQTSLHFIATDVSETLSFLALGSPTGYPPVSQLDGVSMTEVLPAAPPPAVPVPLVPPVVTPVPERGSLVLIGGGLLAVGAATRRRARQ